MTKNIKKIIWLSAVVLLFSVSLVLPARAQGASLYLSPSSGTYTVGSTFSVRVMVNSGGAAINAAEGALTFNSNELEVLKVSKSNSVFNLWVAEPSFSNSAGTVSFTGGTTDSFTGTAGNIITITFKAHLISTSKVSFSTGSVLADDYKGTNVLTNLSSGVYTVKPAEITPPAEEYIPLKGTPAAPVVSSPTHPDSEKWHENSSPKFTWEVPSDITGVRLLVDRLSAVVPTVFYSKPITERQLEDLEDGVWYFHVQLRNQAGWGKVSHFKFQIDTQPPKPFKIEAKEEKETTNPQPTLLFETTDEMSGIDYYEIMIDGKSSTKTERPEYKIPSQDLGKHTIIVKAVDKAGNETLVMTDIEILPIEAPVITDHPRELLPGSTLSVKGTALPEATVKIYIQKEKEEAKIGETKSDKEGKWVYVEVEPAEKGVYQIWAETIDSSGAKSMPSEKVTVLVSPPVFIRIGKLAIDYLTTIMTLLILILAIILGILWGWREVKKRRKKIQKETSEAEKALHQAFKTLKEGTEEQVAKLDGKAGLSKREKKICNDLKKTLKNSEKFIGKKIKDIEKEIKK